MDKKHDKHGVNTFIQASIDHLRKKDIPIEEILEYTDHSAAQYKSKFTFFYLTRVKADGKVIPSSRHFFGVKHGKGPSDQAGGTFKRTIRDAVKGGEILLNADAVKKFCERKYDHQQNCKKQGNTSCDRNSSDFVMSERDVNGADGDRDETEVDCSCRQRNLSDFVTSERDVNGAVGDRDETEVVCSSRRRKNDPHSLSKVFNHKKITRP